jgi:hypothetical protein
VEEEEPVVPEGVADGRARLGVGLGVWQFVGVAEGLLPATFSQSRSMAATYSG